MTAPIFLYLRSAKPHSDTLKKLRDAGYITMAVDSLNDVKIISQGDQLGENNVTMAEINRLAFEAISTSCYSSIREDFGLRVTKFISAKKPV